MRFAAIALLGLVLLPAPARADEPPPAGAAVPVRDAEVTRLLDAKKSLHWNATLPGRAERYGHAEALVEASADKVRDTALQFGLYREFHRKFESARVIGKEGDSTDVYMKLPVRLGPFKFDQWAVMRFSPARSAPGGVFVVEGRSIKGNVKGGHIVMTIRPVDAKHALVKVDLLLVPSMPAPRSMVDEELRDAAFDFVNGLRDKSQGWSGPVVTL